MNFLLPVLISFNVLYLKKLFRLTGATHFIQVPTLENNKTLKLSGKKIKLKKKKNMTFLGRQVIHKMGIHII
jgi:hypothetical protein